MEWRLGRRARRGGVSYSAGPRCLMAALCAVRARCAARRTTCSHSRPRSRAAPPSLSNSIDGPPPAQFQKLVQDLNDEAQTRRLAVMSREQPSAYRVRGYLAAEVAKGATTISWVWDVFDGDQRRSLRITGDETVKGRHRDAWQAVDDAMLRRIAQSQHDRARRFLNLSRSRARHAEQRRRRQVSAGDRLRPRRPVYSSIFHPNADPCRGRRAGRAGGGRRSRPDPAPPPGSGRLRRRRDAVGSRQPSPPIPPPGINPLSQKARDNGFAAYCPPRPALL